MSFWSDAASVGTLVRLGLRRRRSDADYRRLQRYLAERALADLETRGVDVGSSRMLELAAGKGGFSEIFAEHAGSFVASDVQRFEALREDLPFELVDVNQRFPFDDGAFDLVYSSSLIEHLADPGNMLSESVRVLRPGGTLYLSFPPFYSLLLVGGHQFKPFHLFGERLAVALTNRRTDARVSGYADAYGDIPLVPLRVGEVRQLLSEHVDVLDSFTRFSPINTTRWPGWLADWATWHACYIGRAR